MSKILNQAEPILGSSSTPIRRKPRCTIDLSPRIESKLEAMAETYGETKAEIVRRALEHFLKCREYQQKGFETGAFREQPDGSVRLVAIDAGVD